MRKRKEARCLFGNCLEAELPGGKAVRNSCVSSPQPAPVANWLAEDGIGPSPHQQTYSTTRAFVWLDGTQSCNQVAGPSSGRQRAIVLIQIMCMAIGQTKDRRAMSNRRV